MQPTFGCYTRRGAVTILVFGAVALAALAPAAAQGRRAATPVPPKDPCAAPANAVIAENCKPGNPETEWDINAAGDPSIQGFAINMSVNHGESVSFKVRTDAAAYRVDIYRIGYYGGMGARLVTTLKPSAALPQRQPDCLREAATRLYDCGNWAVSASWQVPVDAASGVYAARLVRNDQSGTWRADNSLASPREKPPALPQSYGASGLGKLANALKEPRASHMIFVVRADELKSDIVFQTSDLAWQAYNRYGGASTYGGFLNGADLGQNHRAYKMSYNRPLTNRGDGSVNEFFNAEYPMVRWLEANGYDVTYIAGVDSTRAGEKLKEHKLFLSNGHDEYWDGQQRRNVEAARDAGVNLAFFSGNEVYWKTRWEPSIDGSKTPYRTLVCYKETHSRIDDHGEYQPGAKIDPKKDEWTGTYRDASPFNPEGPNPENSLTGTIFTVDAWRHDIIQVPAKYGKHRFWRNTSVATLKPGEVALLEGANLGHEWDEDLDNGFRPAGIQHLSETTANNVAYLQDFGSIDDGGTATHNLTLYRAKSGALVFGAGTVEWSWGLDAHHDNIEGMPNNFSNGTDARIGLDPRAPDVRVQQATVNLFADMGVQPLNLQPGQVKATKSVDVLAPVSKILAIPGGVVAAGAVTTIHGTASDMGGIVAAVEVSVDGGRSWHPAAGEGSWTYEWQVPAEFDGATITSRAVDDSGNLEKPLPGVKTSGSVSLTRR